MLKLEMYQIRSELRIGKGIKLYKLEDITEKGFKILLFLLKVKGAKIKDFYDKLHLGRETVYRCLRYLDKYGLIDEKRRGNVRFIFLTEKGRRVALLLKEIEEILESKET